MAQNIFGPADKKPSVQSVESVKICGSHEKKQNQFPFNIPLPPLTSSSLPLTGSPFLYGHFPCTFEV
jgi:hypothetical protein